MEVTFFDNILFCLSAFAVLMGAFLVAFTKNLVHSCVYLLFTFLGVAGLYLTLSADFLAATQLVVYAGGVVILMLFAVMLTGGARESLNRLGINKIKGMGSLKTYIIAGISSLIFGLVLFRIVSNFFNYTSNLKALKNIPTVEKIGEALITDHVLAFEISSILLLGALVGAAMIARPKRGGE